MTLQLTNISLDKSGEAFLTAATATFQAGINVLVRRTTAGKTSLMPVMAGLERAGVHSECGSKLNEERGAQYSFDHPGAPNPKLAHGRGAPQTPGTSLSQDGGRQFD